MQQREPERNDVLLISWFEYRFNLYPHLLRQIADQLYDCLIQFKK